MIVCICLNINEKEIKELLNQGLSLEEIRIKLKLGSDCGICLQDQCLETENQCER